MFIVQKHTIFKYSSLEYDKKEQFWKVINFFFVRSQWIYFRLENKHVYFWRDHINLKKKICCIFRAPSSMYTYRKVENKPIFKTRHSNAASFFLQLHVISPVIFLRTKLKELLALLMADPGISTAPQWFLKVLKKISGSSLVGFTGT